MVRARNCRLIRYDGRGNGLSDRYVPEISFATFEHDLEAVVDAHRLQRYALLGISQGVPIAIAHAVRYPERVSKLVLNGDSRSAATSATQQGIGYFFVSQRNEAVVSD